jgi:hypothetical protein
MRGIFCGNFSLTPTLDRVFQTRSTGYIRVAVSRRERGKTTHTLSVILDKSKD